MAEALFRFATMQEESQNLKYHMVCNQFPKSHFSEIMKSNISFSPLAHKLLLF